MFNVHIIVMFNYGFVLNVLLVRKKKTQKIINNPSNSIPQCHIICVACKSSDLSSHIFVCWTYSIWYAYCVGV